MAELTTFILLDRDIVNWRWYKNTITFQVFVHLLLKANAKDKAFEDMIIHRGEVVVSYGKLAEDLGLTVQQIRTAINHLKSTGEITSKSTSKFTVITIVNYNKYQASNSYVTSKSTSRLTNNQQAINKRPTTTKSVKSDKSVKENISPFQGISIEEARNQ